MSRSNRELWLALIAIIFITLAYLFMLSQYGEVPAASGFYGHMLGVIGFILMLMTEILYSLRKRSRSARWGRMADWLRFHIFTGLVGPYMVLLHSSWKFNGLAGVVLLLTTLIVLSGVVGRYIYTAVPRTVDGVEIETAQLADQIKVLEERFLAWAAQRPELLARLPADLIASRDEVEVSALALVFGRSWRDVQRRWRWWRLRARLSGAARMQLADLERLLQQRRALQRQVASLASARRLLAIWHAVHIPVGILLFSTAFIHIGAALYYATLLR